MRCRRCRKLIPLYIDGELDSVKCAQVEYHVRHCKACARELKWQQWICEVLRSFPAMSPPADFTARTMERLRVLRTHRKFHEPFTFTRPYGWKVLNYGYRMAGAAAVLMIGVMIWSWLRTTPMAVDSISGAATNVTMASNVHAERLPVKPTQVAKASTQQHTVLSSAVERSDAQSSHGKSTRTIKMKRDSIPMLTPPSTEKLAKSNSNGAIASAGAKKHASAVMLVKAGGAAPRVSRGVENSPLVNAQLTLTTDAFIPVSYAPPRTALPKDTYMTRLQSDGNPKIVSAREQLLTGKPWKAVQTLTGLLDEPAVSQWERYQVLRLLKYAHEKMGEWVLASALKEQLLNEVERGADVNTALRLAQVCETDGDVALARELYARIASMESTPTRMRANARTRLAALQPKLKAPVSTDTTTLARSEIALDAENHSIALHQLDNSANALDKMQWSLSVLERKGNERHVEELLRNDPQFVDALFKLAEAT